MNDSQFSSPLWDKGRAAEYLGIARSTLDHWVSDRRIVFVKMGRLVKFRKNDLDRFIAKNVRQTQTKRRSDELA
jgi:excisionase family DNA binding protein